MKLRPQWPNLSRGECRDRIRKNPKDLEARLALGMTYRLQGDYRAALEIWRSILDIDAAHAPAKGLIRSLHAELAKINFPLD